MQIRPSTQTQIPTHQGPAGRQPADQMSGKADMPRIRDTVMPGMIKPQDVDIRMPHDKVRDGGRGIQAPQAERDMPSNGEVRKQLAGIDRSMRKRVMAMGKEQGLEPAESRALAKEFHKGIKTAFDAFKAGDLPDKKALMLEVRKAFQTMKEGLHSQIAAANETSGANTTPTLTSTNGSAVSAAGNVVATQTPSAGSTIQDPVSPPVAGGGSTAGTGSGAVGNVVATQTAAASSTTPSTAPTPFNRPDLIVDPTLGGPEDIAAAAGISGNGVTDGLASLVERFEAAVDRLGELFERSGMQDRDHEGGQRLYDAGGMRNLETLIGRRFDALA